MEDLLYEEMEDYHDTKKILGEKILPFLTCAGLLLTSPVFAEAATQAERSAYQAVFDADYYRSAYPDVAAAFGNNKTALFNHFVNYGLKEGEAVLQILIHRHIVQSIQICSRHLIMIWQHTVAIMCPMEKQRAEMEAEMYLPVQLHQIRLHPELL